MLQDTALLLICLRKKPLTKSRKLLNLAKESLKSTRDGSAGSDPKGYLIFQETSLLGNESSPLVVYFVNILIGIFFFFCRLYSGSGVIWEFGASFIKRRKKKNHSEFHMKNATFFFLIRK